MGEIDRVDLVGQGHGKPVMFDVDTVVYRVRVGDRGTAQDGKGGGQWNPAVQVAEEERHVGAAGSVK